MDNAGIAVLNRLDDALIEKLVKSIPIKRKQAEKLANISPQERRSMGIKLVLSAFLPDDPANGVTFKVNLQKSGGFSVRGISEGLATIAPILRRRNSWDFYRSVANLNPTAREDWEIVVGSYYSSSWYQKEYEDGIYIRTSRNRIYRSRNREYAYASTYAALLQIPHWFQCADRLGRTIAALRSEFSINENTDLSRLAIVNANEILRQLENF